MTDATITDTISEADKVTAERLIKTKGWSTKPGEAYEAFYTKRIDEPMMVGNPSLLKALNIVGEKLGVHAALVQETDRPKYIELFARSADYKLHVEPSLPNPFRG